MRHAALPEARYEPEATFPDPTDPYLVRVYPEDRSPSKDFSFAAFPLSIELRTAFAVGFERATGRGGSRRTTDSALSLYSSLRRFSHLLAALEHPPLSVEGFRASHVDMVRLLNDGSTKGILGALRLLFSGDERITQGFVSRLFMPFQNVKTTKVSGYSPEEHRRMLRAARIDVRAAAKRIRGSIAKLDAWRDGRISKDTNPLDFKHGKLLDFVAKNGDVPKSAIGTVSMTIRPWFAKDLCLGLFLSAGEVGALLVLLISYTGQNGGTLYNLRSGFWRMDGGDGETAAVNVRASKPRRGPYKSEMNLTFTDIPSWIGGSKRPESEKDELDSAFGIYVLAHELCSPARDQSGSNRLFLYYANRYAGANLRNANQDTMGQWAGFLDEYGAVQRVSSQRLRRTYLNFHQRPVAQSAHTLANTYLSRDSEGLMENQRIVDGVLQDELLRTRALTVATSLRDSDLVEARTSPSAVAARFGISALKLQELIAGRLDTVATGCVDHDHSPFSPEGNACTASFLLCLGCPNARSEPRHAPIQGAMAIELQLRRPDMAGPTWDHRYGTASAQLEGLLRDQEIDAQEAAAQASDEDRLLLKALLDGRLDIR